MISDEKVEDLTQGKDYTVNDRQVTLAAPTGLKIKIYRVTTTKPLVGWADASVLRAADMTVQSTQLLHLAEETSDLAQDGGLSKDTADNVWDARFNKIKNLLDPTDPGDAVTLNYITKNKDSLINQLNATGDNQNTLLIATGDTQNARLVHTGNTQNARLNSTGDTQNARLETTGDTQNARLNDTGDLQNTRLTTTGNNYVSTMTSLKNTATDKATEATNQASLAKKWAVSETSPDGGSASKSSKTWAGEAKTAASNAASSASASASSATASHNSASSSASYASTATQKATEAASSATAAATSASNAATSATNAKASETKAASSANEAAASADRAATWDPTHYIKTIDIAKPDNNGHRCLFLFEEIKRDDDDYLRNLYGGSFSIYPYVRYGNNYQLEFPPVCCAISFQYRSDTTVGYNNWSTNKRYLPLIVRNNTTNKVYWGISIDGSDHKVKMFGAFAHNISVIDTLLSSVDGDVYDGYTVLHTADVITPAKASDIPSKLSQLTNDANFAKTSDLPTKTSQLTNDSGFAVIRNGHLVINGSELWIE